MSVQLTTKPLMTISRRLAYDVTVANVPMVKTAVENQVKVADAAGQPIEGVLLSPGRAGEMVSIVIDGVVPVLTAGAVGRGDFLITSADGRMKSAITGNVAGTALTPCQSENELVSMQISADVIADIHVSRFGAKVDGVILYDVTVTAGSANVVTAAQLSDIDVGKVFVFSMMRKTTATVTGDSVVVADATGAAVNNPIWIFGDTESTAFKTNIAAITGTTITLSSASPTNGSGVTVLMGNYSLAGTITAVKGGTVTLSQTPAASGLHARFAYGSDDTAAIQAAIDAASQKGLPVLLGSGISMIGGALRSYSDLNTGDACHAQLLIPQVAAGQAVTGFALWGRMGMGGTQGFLNISQPNPKTSVLISTSTAGAAGDSILACLRSDNALGFNAVNVDLRRITFMQVTPGVLTNTDIRNATSYWREDILHTTLLPWSMSVVPANTNNIADRSPSANNAVQVGGDRITVVGYYDTVDLREHDRIGHLWTNGCYRSLYLGRDTYARGHHITIDRLSTEQCQYGIVWGTNSTPCFLDIRDWDIEQNASDVSVFPGTGIKDLPKWVNIVKDLSDPSGYARGHIRFGSTDLATGVKDSLNFVATESHHMKITAIAGEQDGWYGSDLYVNPSGSGISNSTYETWQNLDGTITVPAAGDWDITFHIPFCIVAASQYINVTFRLAYYNGSAWVGVAGSEVQFSTPFAGLTSALACKAIAYRSAAAAQFGIQVLFNQVSGGTVAFFQAPYAGDGAHSGGAVLKANTR